MGKLNFKIGQRVWWNDPAGETSGYYTIDSDVQNDVWELQEQGGDDRSILSDLIIEISNEAGSEAQVHAHELRYVYEGCYRELSDRQYEIHRDLEAFIRQHINESGGRITLNIDEEKRLSCECDSDIYPILTILHGKHGHKPEIGITDVYLNNNDGIYTDGYDTGGSCMERGFYITPDQYSDVAYFIAVVKGIAE